jgi:hypothetical protein
MAKHEHEHVGRCHVPGEGGRLGTPCTLLNSCFSSTLVRRRSTGLSPSCSPAPLLLFFALGVKPMFLHV